MNTKIKKTIFWGTIALMGGLVSCGEKVSTGSKEYLAVKQEGDALWSMLAPDGKMLFENEFKQNISDAVDGLFLVPEDHQKTLYKAEPVPMPLGNYTNLADVGMPNEGKVVLIDRDGLIMAIKTNGDILFSLPPEIITCHAYFNNGLLGVCNEKAQWGFVNEKGEQVIPCKYITVTPFSEGHAIVAEYRNDRIKLSIIDEQGNITAVVQNYLFLIPSSTTFHNGRIPVVNVDDQFGFLTVDGIFEKCSYKVTGIANVTDHGFIFRKSDGKYGAMDYKGEILVQPRYDELAFIPGSRNYIAKIKNRYSELDEKGEKIMDFTDYKYMAPGTPGFPIIASTGNRYEILNANGQPITKTDFADVNTKIGFTVNILNPTSSDLVNFNFEVANYLEQVFRGFSIMLDMVSETSVDDIFGTETEGDMDTPEVSDTVETEEVAAQVVETPQPAAQPAAPAQTTSKPAAPASSSKLTAQPATGKYNYGYATYQGQLKDGKPNGRGKLVFTAAHSDNVRNYQAEKGDYIEGNFTNGQLDNGSLYKSDGTKVKTIY